MPASVKSIASAKAMRLLIRKNDDRRDKGLPTEVKGVTRFNDISYGPAGKWNLLDIYVPDTSSDDKYPLPSASAHGSTGTAAAAANSAPNAASPSEPPLRRPVPAIINIHGGGWIYGTKETYQFYGLSLARQGFAFVNFNYRLAPEAVFPEELDDVNSVFHWVAGHAGQYGLDADNIFVIGDSAGGQMACQYLTALADPGFRAKFGYEVPRLTVRAAAINCGASFIDTPEAVAGAAECYFTPEVFRDKADMLRTEDHMTDGLPPLFIQTANHDFIRDCSVRLDGFLTGKGILHEFHSYGTDKHPQEHVFECDIRNKEARKCNRDELDFFRRYIRQ